MRRRVLPVLFVMILVAGSLGADQLELANGDVITGTIQLMDARSIIIETEYGVLEVKRSLVVRGEFGLPAGEVSDSLVFAFDFDGSLSDTTGVYRAVNNGMRFAADRDGNKESALRSDGTGTFLSIAPTDELNSLDQFSLFFFVRLEEISTTQYLVSKWLQAASESADGKFTVQASSGNITLYLVAADGTYHRLVARNVLDAGVWKSVAVTFADGRALIYVDGSQVASQRFSFDSLFVDDSPLLVMTALSQTDDSYGYYNATGTIDNLRLYSRALSPEEIELLAGIGEE